MFETKIRAWILLKTRQDLATVSLSRIRTNFPRAFLTARSFFRTFIGGFSVVVDKVQHIRLGLIQD